MDRSRSLLNDAISIPHSEYITVMRLPPFAKNDDSNSFTEKIFADSWLLCYTFATRELQVDISKITCLIPSSQSVLITKRFRLSEQTQRQFARVWHYKLTTAHSNKTQIQVLSRLPEQLSYSTYDIFITYLNDELKRLSPSWGLPRGGLY